MARIELLDELTIDAINRHTTSTMPVAPTLFLEFHGTRGEVAEQAERTEQIAAEHGGDGLRVGHRRGRSARLWDARHDAYFATRALRPGTRALTTDVCVPVSRAGRVHRCATRADIDEPA